MNLKTESVKLMKKSRRGFQMDFTIWEAKYQDKSGYGDTREEALARLAQMLSTNND